MNAFVVQLLLFVALAPVIWLVLRWFFHKPGKTNRSPTSSRSTETKAKPDPDDCGTAKTVLLCLCVAAGIAFIDSLNFDTLIKCYDRSQDGRDVMATVVETKVDRIRSKRGRTAYESQAVFDGGTIRMPGRFERGEKLSVVYSKADPRRWVWGTTQSGFMGLVWENLSIINLLLMVALTVAGTFCFLLLAATIFPNTIGFSHDD